MKNKLIHHPHIELRKSPIHGYGVFASDFICKDTILEEVPFLEIPRNVAFDYLFAYPRGGTPEEEMIGVDSTTALALGFASLYNHGDRANASWRTDTKNKLFVFFAQEDIQKDEEILVYYGPSSYWVEHPHVNKL
jgi:uncharacterized protein